MKDFFRQNGLLILIAAVLLSLVMLVMSLLLGGIANPFANLMGVITTPVRNGVDFFLGWTEGVYHDAFAREQMGEENDALKERVATLEEQSREAEAALRENERLRNALELRPKQRKFTLESATVTARGSTNWSHELTISKGSLQGVAVGDCVVDEYWNLVGVVRQVGTNWATVGTVVDAETEMGGKLARTDGAAILEGDFTLMGEGKLKLSYLPGDSALLSGDVVLTSGMGGVYPSGLVVGAVEEVRTEASGMTQYAIIVPKTELNGLEQVFVIKDFDIVE